MKYDVTYSCGHTGTVQIYGTAAEREKKIAWYENYAVCPDCYKQAQQEEVGLEEQVAKRQQMWDSLIECSEGYTEFDDESSGRSFRNHGRGRRHDPHPI